MHKHRITPEATKNLLQEVQKIIEKHKILAIKKGEDFNLFSIMQMESNETFTHSAIISALLDPKGNHYKGELFLELFLDEIKYDYTGERLELTVIKTEFHIGKIDNKCEKGGFIDILIEFSSGKTIAIENKIYANDQPGQLYRYKQYNRKKTSIYYLNLFGVKPSEHSHKTLKENEDYNIVSYQNHILKWLKKCIENSTNELIVNSSIKQYFILIQKLTHTMDKTREKELKNAIIDNLEAAKYVSHNYTNIIYNIREQFRQHLINSLKTELTVDYVVREGKTPNNEFSHIFIQPRNFKNKKIEFAIESFSGRGHHGGKLYIGIIDRLQTKPNIKFINITEDKYLSEWWPVTRPIKTMQGNNFHLNSESLLKKISDQNSPMCEKLVNHVTEQAVDFIQEYTSTLLEVQNNALKEEA